jgi:hypothetical protein
MGGVVGAKVLVLIALLLGACAFVYAPNATITVDDADTITIRDNEALTK